MPQLEVSTFVPQLFWLAVTFLLLYLLMKSVALPRVGAVLEQRRNRLDEDFAQATELKSEAEAVIAAYERALAAARVEAQSIMRETSERLLAEAAERQRQLLETLAIHMETAERQIVSAKQRAASEIREVAVEVASSIAARLTNIAVDKGRAENAVDRAVAERRA